METKQSLRERMRALLAAQPAPERSRRSAEAALALAASGPYRRAKGICFYVALPGEVETRPAIEAALGEGKRVFVPRVEGDRLALYEIRSLAELVPGAYGVGEPDPSHRVEADARLVDCVVVPALAFDAEGRRLGRGRGYYDRLLAALGRGPARLGLAFSFQRVPRVPEDAHDQRVDNVLTDQG